MFLHSVISKGAWREGGRDGEGRASPEFGGLGDTILTVFAD